MANEFDHQLHVFRSPRLRSIVREAIAFFDQTPVHFLPPPERFTGTGVYALYYTGSFDLYAQISAQNRQAVNQPIYVGKAVPSGWRTGRVSKAQTSVLYSRLREHARSIGQASNLRLDDFGCRFMILTEVESDLIVPVESELIRKYEPVWNALLDGFGNHDPGSGRYNQAKSEWDILHPGRSWADRLTGQSPLLDEIVLKLKMKFNQSGPS